MKARKLDEILEESLTAYLEGRRSIEDSLSLYPSVASELAPLLRTAVDVSRTFDGYEPPEHVRERGLQRFLNDARARRRLKALARDTEPTGFVPSWLRGIFSGGRMGLVGAAAAVAVITIAVGSAALLDNGSGSNDGIVQPIPTQNDDTETPVAVANLQSQIASIRARIDRGETVTVDDLLDIATKAKAVGAAEVEGNEEAVTAVFNDADDLFNDVVATQPDLADEADDAQGAVRNVAGGLGIDLPPASPAGTPATPPAVTDAPTAPASPTTAPTAAPTAAPTPGSTTTSAPTPPPEPTATPAPRSLPGINP